MSKKLFNKVFNSPTLMTWLNYLARSGNLLFILPLILKKFEAPEIAVWYLFAAILAMSGIADFGFRSTFVRVIAYAFGGAEDIENYQNDKSSVGKSDANWLLIERIFSSMRRIYFYLSFLLFLALISIGTYSLYEPISHLSNQSEAWEAWILFSISISIYFYGRIFSNYLEGLFKIALVKRVEFLFKLASIVTSLIVLVFFPSFLNLIIAQSIWLVINVLRNVYIARLVFEGKYKQFRKLSFEKELFWKIWKPAWRAGISGLMSIGLTNSTGIIYAQIGDPAAVASYMIALRIVSEIRNVSNAPFYSKIPLLSRYRAENDNISLIKVAKKGMLIAHMVFVIGVIVVGVFFNYFLSMIGSNVDFVSKEFWVVLSFAFYFHRFGALHMQLYLTTNHVISHIADFISGLIFIGSTLILLNFIDLYAIPVGMILSYLGFYSWYALRYSLKSINQNLFKFEKDVSFIPFTLLLIYFSITLFIY